MLCYIVGVSVHAYVRKCVNVRVCVCIYQLYNYRLAHVSASELEVAMQSGWGWKQPVIKEHSARHVGHGNATPFLVWARKLGLVAEIPQNAAMTRGKRCEEHAVKHYELRTGQVVHRGGHFISSCLGGQQEQYTLGYSPDGIVVASDANNFSKDLIEVKAPFLSTKRASPLDDKVCACFCNVILCVCLLVCLFALCVLARVLVRVVVLKSIC